MLSVSLIQKVSLFQNFGGHCRWRDTVRTRRHLECDTREDLFHRLRRTRIAVSRGLWHLPMARKSATMSLPSKLHSSQDASDIVVDRPTRFTNSTSRSRISKRRMCSLLGGVHLGIRCISPIGPVARASGRSHGPGGNEMDVLRTWGLESVAFTFKDQWALGRRPLRLLTQNGSMTRLQKAGQCFCQLHRRK